MPCCHRIYTVVLLSVGICIQVADARDRSIPLKDSLEMLMEEPSDTYVPLLLTQNQAALWYLPVQQSGNSSVSGSVEGGNYRRPQQPRQSQELLLSTERYHRTDNILWYGKFSFMPSQDKDIAWNSLLDPYRGTPYVLADSIGGDWKKQRYSLQAKASSRPLWGDKVNLGMDAQYELATGAKQLDPRPLNYTNFLQLSPSILWNMTERQQLGMSLKYAYFKEDISMEIRQPNTTHNLYRFKGLSIHDGTIPITSGTHRDYQSNTWGAEIQHQMTWTQGYDLVSALTYDRIREETLDGSTLPSPAGDFARDLMQMTVGLRKKKGSIWQQVLLKASHWQDEGTEYHTTYDNAQGKYIVSFSGVMYEQQGYQASLGYHLGEDLPARGIRRRVYVSVDMDQTKSLYRYTQPTDQDLLRLSYRIGTVYHTSKRRYEAQIRYRHSPSGSLHYTAKAGPNTAAQQILFPDHDYLASSSGSIDLGIQQFFGTIGRRTTRWYVQAKGRYERRIDKVIYDPYDSDRYRIQIGFGAYY